MQNHSAFLELEPDIRLTGDTASAMRGLAEALRADSMEPIQTAIVLEALADSLENAYEGMNGRFRNVHKANQTDQSD